MFTDHRAAIDHLCDWFESLSPGSLARLGEFYTPDARFKDPFNEVQGIPAITRVFEHMFDSLTAPHFIVTGRLVDSAQCFLVWEFRFRFQRFDTVTEQVVRGGSHLRLAPDGRVSDHRDYWDAAEELYEKLPVLGGLMRWLKKKAQE
ncbi:nuclear transport factor 2 family protein [Hydrogenophaga sp. ANAO-22]|uniref:nuclear transport factor 2 family protein n=1 Tax=Hydrogenophaga sp. ANAO-22 TaxID=3166645 RepID=UPI0036D22D37